MRYYVLDPSGAKFGPADVAMLDQWAQEGRVIATTMLEEESTGRRFPASHFPPLAMRFQGHPAFTTGGHAGPSGPGFTQPDAGPARMRTAWICAVASMFAGLCCPKLCVLLGIVAIVLAYLAGPNAPGRTLCVITAILGILGSVLLGGIMAQMMNTGL